MQQEINEDDDDAGTPGLQAELIKSYLAFARRAIANRIKLAGALFLTLLVLTSVALAVWPRSYGSELRLIVQRSEILDPDGKSNPLESASDVILRRDNIEALVVQLGLAKSWDSLRSPTMKLKDRATEALRGKPSQQDLNDALVSMVEGRLWVRVDGSSLSIGADWPEAATAKRLVDAAKDSFLQMRHNAEISVIEEKMSILEGHATRLRSEIEEIAQDLSRMKEEKLAAAQNAAREVRQANAAVPSAAPSPVVRRLAPMPTASAAPGPAEDLPSLKEELESKKRKLAELTSRRNQSLLEAKGKFVDLKLRYTDDHPEVRAMEQRISLLATAPQEETSLTVEVETLESHLKQVTAAARLETAAIRLEASGSTGRGGGAAASSAVGAPANEPLPHDILQLLENPTEMDPAISAQLSTAIGKYSELRSDIRGSRIKLDTAQAAFNHRYRIVSPADIPIKPSKPKVPMVFGIGLLVGLALALLVPIVLELRTDIVVERWQVHQLRMPILGDLRFPPEQE